MELTKKELLRLKKLKELLKTHSAKEITRMFGLRAALADYLDPSAKLAKAKRQRTDDTELVMELKECYLELVRYLGEEKAKEMAERRDGLSK